MYCLSFPSGIFHSYMEVTIASERERLPNLGLVSVKILECTAQDTQYTSQGRMVEYTSQSIERTLQNIDRTL